MTPQLAERIIRQALRELGPGWAVMPIGGTAMGRLPSGRSVATKDIDLVAVVMTEGNAKIPDFEALVTIATKLAGPNGEVRPRKDHTSVEITFPTDAGRVKLELIRGRGAQGGYFVTRRVLEVAIKYSAPREGVLDMPPDALAFLKAWAEHDQAKLIAAGKDERGFHARRKEGFRRDVETIRADMLQRGTAPRSEIMTAMLDACGKERREAISAILRETGWAIAS